MNHSKLRFCYEAHGAGAPGNGADDNGKARPESTTLRVAIHRPAKLPVQPTSQKSAMANS